MIWYHQDLKDPNAYLNVETLLSKLLIYSNLRLTDNLRRKLDPSNPYVSKLKFYGSEENICYEEIPERRPSKSAKIHPTAKKICGWE